jgi:hypothetical protein
VLRKLGLYPGRATDHNGYSGTPPTVLYYMSLKYNIKSFYLHLCSLFLRKFLLWIGLITILNTDERLVKHHEALRTAGARADNNITEFVDNAVIRWEIIAASIRID